MTGTADGVVVAKEDPRQDDVRAMVTALDQNMRELYEPNACHLRAIDDLAVEDTDFFVARVDGRAVGCGAIAPVEGGGEVKRMWVAPEVRRLGVAWALLRTLETAARERGYAAMFLEVGDAQPAALALYLNFGFATREPFGDYDDHPNLIFMEKPLSAMDAPQ